MIKKSQKLPGPSAAAGPEIISRAARFTVFAVSPESVFCISENETHLLDGAIYRDLFSQLAAPRERDALIDILRAQYSELEIQAALSETENLGLILRGVPAFSRGRQAYWELQPVLDAAVSIEFLAPKGSRTIRDVLATHGLRICEDAGLLIVVTDDYLRPELGQIAVREEPWLLAKAVGEVIWVGPFFAPGLVCWRCLAAAIAANRWRQASVLGFGPEALPPEPSVAATPATIALAAGLISTAVAGWISEGRFTVLENAIFTLNTRTLRHATNTVRPRPDCPTCRLSASAREPVLDNLISPVTGIVSRLEVTPEPVEGLYHARAEHIHPLPMDGARPLLKSMTALGSGVSQTDARQASVGEAVERYSMTFQGREQRLRARSADICALTPNELLLISDSQYRDRERWNATHSDLHFVPEPFDPNEEIEWTGARSLSNGRTVYVPTEYCYLWHSSPRFCRADSNGCGAGSTREAALLHALLELVERDAVAIWWYNRLRRPALCPDFLKSDPVRAILAALKAQDRSVHILDVTSDLQIPACVAIAAGTDGSAPFFASAAHPSAEIAAYKALKELVQIRFWTGTGPVSQDFAHWLETANLAEQVHMVPDGFSSLQSCAADSDEAWLGQSIERLGRAGLEAFFVDLTRGEIGVPAVRVIVPGLRHFWIRLAPGRLYDVPLTMGWLSAPRSETGMNPIGCML